MSWYPQPARSHSGKYSFAVAALVSGGPAVVPTSKTTDVTPASLSLAAIVGACSWTAWVAAAVSSGTVNATFVATLPTPLSASCFSKTSRSIWSPVVVDVW
jgi:hypothetical protein